MSVPNSPTFAKTSTRPPSRHPIIPHQGPAEVHIRSAYRNVFNGLAAYFRSPDWITDLGGDFTMDNLGAVMALVDEVVGEFLQVFAEEYGVAIAPVIELGKSVGVAEVGAAYISEHTLLKAQSAVVPADEPLPQRRRRLVPTWMQQRPSKLFKLPRRTYVGKPTIPNARDLWGSFGFAPGTNIAAAQYLPYDLIVRITAGQRDAIRQVIVDSITHGYDPYLAGVMVSNLVGLFPRWQRAVTTYYNTMLDNGAPGRVAIARANQYGDHLRAKRGLMIARTELMRAQNYGRLDGWREQGDEQGLFDTATSEKKWHAAPDACDQCAEMAGVKVVGIETPFDTNWGMILMPPAHPHCRCTATIRPVFARSDD